MYIYVCCDTHIYIYIVLHMYIYNMGHEIHSHAIYIYRYIYILHICSMYTYILDIYTIDCVYIHISIYTTEA